METKQRHDWEGSLRDQEAHEHKSNLEVTKTQKPKTRTQGQKLSNGEGRWPKPPCLSLFGMTPQRCILGSWPMLFFEAPLSPWVT
jgi:hypothetical protein